MPHFRFKSSLSALSTPDGPLLLLRRVRSNDHKHVRFYPSFVPEVGSCELLMHCLFLSRKHSSIIKFRQMPPVMAHGVRLCYFILRDVRHSVLISVLYLTPFQSITSDEFTNWVSAQPSNPSRYSVRSMFFTSPNK